MDSSLGIVLGGIVLRPEITFGELVLSWRDLVPHFAFLHSFQNPFARVQFYDKRFLIALRFIRNDTSFGLEG